MVSEGGADVLVAGKDVEAIEFVAASNRAVAAEPTKQRVRIRREGRTPVVERPGQVTRRLHRRCCGSPDPYRCLHSSCREVLVEYSVVVDQVGLLHRIEQRPPVAPGTSCPWWPRQVPEVLVVDEAPVLCGPVLVELALDRLWVRRPAAPIRGPSSRATCCRGRGRSAWHGRAWRCRG